MERMEMHSRNEYLKVIREKYFKVRTKKEKSQILNEYCSNTGQSRKHVSSGRYTSQLSGQSKGRKERRYMMARLELAWLRYGKSLIILAGRG